MAINSVFFSILAHSAVWELSQKKRRKPNTDPSTEFRCAELARMRKLQFINMISENNTTDQESASSWPLVQPHLWFYASGCRMGVLVYSSSIHLSTDASIHQQRSNAKNHGEPLILTFFLLWKGLLYVSFSSFAFDWANFYVKSLRRW